MAEAKRKLAAILSADVVGYSRVMQNDEAATVETLTKYRDVFRDFVLRHDGRVVDSPGDNILSEFDSPVEAVHCAVEIQHELGRRNRQLAEHRQMHFRIGINLGDVISRDDGTIYGDGVNVAARLESLADPGGIMISDSAHMQVHTLIDVGITDAGEHEVKNMARPVHAYRIVGDAQAGSVEPAKALTLPDKPSIAVLPFDNLSGDPDQEYFADGVAEDIITGLSRIRWLFVIARNTSFTYKGQTFDVNRVGRELGVRYVLEGSVRRGGNRVRVTAQLIETEKDHHVWADRYDGTLDDIFELQDEITAKIISALGPELTMAEVERAHHERTKDFNAWDRYLQALPFVYQVNKSAFDRAVSFLNQAIERDPLFSSAHAMLSQCYTLAAYHGWTGRVSPTAAEAIRCGDKATELDPQNPLAHESLGGAHTIRGPQEKAIVSLRRALELDPNASGAWASLAMALSFTGRSEEALAAVEKAKRGSPRDPFMWKWTLAESIAAFADERLEDAIERAKATIQLQPGFYGSRPVLAASAAHLGRVHEAREALADLLRLVPHFTLRGVIKNPMFERPDDVSRLVEGLRKAGLGIPDEPAAAN
jgi:adenylate cyclase